MDHQEKIDRLYEHAKTRDFGLLRPLLHGTFLLYILLCFAFAFTLIVEILHHYEIAPAIIDQLITDNFYNYQILTASAFLITTLLCFFAYARFFYRAMKNLYANNVQALTVKPAWVWGWFFIPFANLLMPFRAIAQFIVAV